MVTRQGAKQHIRSSLDFSVFDMQSREFKLATFRYQDTGFTPEPQSVVLLHQLLLFYQLMQTTLTSTLQTSSSPLVSVWPFLWLCSKVSCNNRKKNYEGPFHTRPGYFATEVLLHKILHPHQWCNTKPRITPYTLNCKICHQVMQYMCNTYATAIGAPPLLH